MSASLQLTNNAALKVGISQHLTALNNNLDEILNIFNIQLNTVN